jgi:hypothetical protein
MPDKDDGTGDTFNRALECGHIIRERRERQRSGDRPEAAPP